MPTQIQRQDSIQDELGSSTDCNDGGRFRSLPAAEANINFQEWRGVIESAFPECLIAAEIGLSVFAQLIIKDIHNPFGLVYVGAPSSGKTTTLNLFSSVAELVYPTDNFTPSSIVSHASNRNKHELKKIDLLPKIRHKLVLVPDLAPIFADRQENLLKNLGILTRIFDGKGYESDSGVHGKRGYKGDYLFMFLACSTPLVPRVWRHMGNLGNRLFFLNVTSPDKDSDELAHMLIDSDYEEKEELCRNMTRNFILGLWEKYQGGMEWDKSGDPMEVIQSISRYAMLLSCLRGSIGNPNDGENSHSEPVIEKPFRINQKLYNLARSHALINGRINLTYDDVWPCRKIVFSSAPHNRLKSLKALIGNKGLLTTSLVQGLLGCSNPTANKELKVLASLNIVKVGRVKNDKKSGASHMEAKLSEEFAWLLDEGLNAM